MNRSIVRRNIEVDSRKLTHSLARVAILVRACFGRPPTSKTCVSLPTGRAHVQSLLPPRSSWKAMHFAVCLSPLWQRSTLYRPRAWRQFARKELRILLASGLAYLPTYLLSVVFWLQQRSPRSRQIAVPIWSDDLFCLGERAAHDGPCCYWL